MRLIFKIYLFWFEGHSQRYSGPFYLMLGATLICPGLTLGCRLRNHSWQGSGVHVCYRDQNLVKHLYRVNYSAPFPSGT